MVAGSHELHAVEVESQITSERLNPARYCCGVVLAVVHNGDGDLVHILKARCQQESQSRKYLMAMKPTRAI
jgi:hypothetical protein